MSLDKLLDLNEYLRYISKDGRFYSTTEELARADAAWKRENLRYKDY